MHEIPIRSFAVSVVVLRSAGSGWEVLLLRRTGTLAGTWCQVAGAIEANETAWQAGLREVEEETGLRLDRFYSADICEQFYEADRDAISLLPVFVGYATANATVRLNAEHSDFRWMSFDEAIRMVPFAGQRKVLKHIRDEFIDNEPNPWLLIQETSPVGAGS
ncbi:MULTISPECIES: NUDIX domain-containing protein [unclassified Ensifer]|uniref:NUDIX hydrolase n=1 Tax=unclassified Ensifer TaxID=2633371 RepID=UPI0008131004|nr:MULTISPECIES: NUDIX domain-containing protein [unclassified Ensifer]OCP07172.1 NUDIX hydrolase [Ensifer sp. LC11]OCP07755.1 NUDIX hydrolase [Ensifer sp. LC13]OCP12083.1 NUDIX hydrolase [Ensifer sp. LC14]OCP31793.1 NUDIX hydrolase [Ensifer sp. LC499]